MEFDDLDAEHHCSSNEPTDKLNDADHEVMDDPGIRSTDSIDGMELFADEVITQFA